MADSDCQSKWGVFSMTTSSDREPMSFQTLPETLPKALRMVWLKPTTPQQVTIRMDKRVLRKRRYCNRVTTKVAAS